MEDFLDVLEGEHIETTSDKLSQITADAIDCLSVAVPNVNDTQVERLYAYLVNCSNEGLLACSLSKPYNTDFDSDEFADIEDEQLTRYVKVEFFQDRDEEISDDNIIVSILMPITDDGDKEGMPVLIDWNFLFKLEA